MAPIAARLRATARSGSTAPRPVVSARDLTRRFGTTTVLEGLDLEVGPGEFVALLGRSGSGKSTLLRLLAGLDRGGEGTLEVDGPVAVAFQDPRLLPWRKVVDNVALGLRSAHPADDAHAALDEVGLAERAGAWPLTLSGGEAQRASLARALVRAPKLLLLDEPFSAVDALTRMAMHDLVLDLWSRHRPAVVLVTHDVDEALTLADRVLVVSEGRIGFQRSVTAPRPRTQGGPDLADLRQALLDALGVGHPSRPAHQTAREARKVGHQP